MKVTNVRSKTSWMIIFVLVTPLPTGEAAGVCHLGLVTEGRQEYRSERQG
jgi:hypothetical protein